MDTEIARRDDAIGAAPPYHQWQKEDAMHNYGYGSIGGSGDPSAFTGYGETQPAEHRRSPLGLCLTIACVAVAAVVGISVVFWALGFVFDMLGWVVRIAILAAVGAFVWRWISHRTSNAGR